MSQVLQKKGSDLRSDPFFVCMVCLAEGRVPTFVKTRQRFDGDAQSEPSSGEARRVAAPAQESKVEYTLTHSTAIDGGRSGRTMSVSM